MAFQVFTPKETLFFHRFGEPYVSKVIGLLIDDNDGVLYNGEKQYDVYVIEEGGFVLRREDSDGIVRNLVRGCGYYKEWKEEYDKEFGDDEFDDQEDFDSYLKRVGCQIIDPEVG